MNDFSIKNPTILQQFSDVANETPFQTAITSEEGGSLLYKDLNARANRLAWSLIKLGVKPGDIVGVCFNRTPNMLIALLGIMKSGAAYVPIDSEIPPARISSMLAETCCLFVITEKLYTPIFEGITKYLYLENLMSDQDENPDVVRLNHLAYVIFTSGSTGKPKGIMVDHQALGCFFSDMRRLTNSDKNDCWLALTSISFDISCVELFLPLVTGGRIHLCGKHLLFDPASLSRLIKEQSITWMQATPSAFNILCDLDNNNEFNLKALIGGEPLTSVLANKIRCRGFKLINMYGPTETTVWSMYEEIFDSVTTPYALIGTALPSEFCYVLDENRNHVPQGLVGELYIGGNGLARGYINDPELTAKNFINDPFNKRLGAKLYKTGDLVRQTQSGSFEYIGRIDDQVKIRGFRIELGEVTIKILEIDEIKDCICLAKSDENGERMLIAYCVANEGKVLSGEQIRQILSQSLPSYMIPSLFYRLDRMPLMSNGKIDRHLLLSDVFCHVLLN